MSDSEDELESAQENQKRVGPAESDPSTSGPADSLREEASENIESSDDEEPVE